MHIKDIMIEAHRNARQKGFHDNPPSFGESIALAHSELSEALESYREGKMDPDIEANGKPVGVPSEFADVIIRVCDTCAALGIDLEEAIELKLFYNKSRPRMHGGKRL